MNISINVAVNQGIINIVSVEESGKREGKKGKGKKDTVVYEQSEGESEDESEHCLILGQVKDKRKSVVVDELFQEIQSVYVPKKMDSVFLSDIYNRLHQEYEEYSGIYYSEKAKRVLDCGSFLMFEVNRNGERKLIKANSCRVRLCPMCMWRRSLKVYREARIVYDELVKEKGSRFLVLTLTQPNVCGDVLKEELDKIFYAFKRLMQLKDIKKICLGFMRSLEVTYNKDTNTYHPHIHCLIHTTRQLYSGVNYITHEEYMKKWIYLLGLDCSFLDVDIRPFREKKGQEGRGISEFCKYSVKPCDYLYRDDIELTKKVINVLDDKIANRRLLSYGGTFRQARKKFFFSDNDDILDDDGIIIDDVDDGYIELYRWHFGEGNYRRVCGREKEEMLKFLVDVKKEKREKKEFMDERMREGLKRLKGKV